MNEKALKVLEYEKNHPEADRAGRLRSGKGSLPFLVPSAELSEILRMQQETSDAVSMLLRKGSVSFSGVTDMRGSLKRLEVGSSLNIDELLRVCRLLETCLRVKSWARGEAGQEQENSLTGMFQSLQPLTPLSAEIRRCIPSEGGDR